MDIGYGFVRRFVCAGVVDCVLQKFAGMSNDMYANVCRPLRGLLRELATVSGL